MTDIFNTPQMLASKMDRRQHRASMLNRMLSFGATMAGNDNIVIIDLSYWVDHTKVDYDRLASQIKGAIIRASYGGWKDTRYDIHYKNFHDRGVPIGAYPYLVGNQTVASQAKAFYEATALSELKMGVWADVEDRRPGTALNRFVVDSFLDTMDTMRNERTEIYTGPYAWSEIMKTGGHSHRKLWIANYGVSTPKMPIGGDWLTWWLWQYTDREKFDGYYSTIDANRFNGTDAEFAKWVNKEVEPPMTLEEQVKDNTRRIEILERK